MHEHDRKALSALDGAHDGEYGVSQSRLLGQMSSHGQSEELRAAAELAGGALREQLEALLDHGLRDVDALLAVLQGADPEQLRSLAADRSLVDRLVGACPVERLPEVLRALFDDPKWMVYHYACRKGGDDPQAIRGLVGLGSLEQRLEMARWGELVGRLAEVFGDAHPDAVVGADLGERIDGDPRAATELARVARRFVEWRRRAEGHDPAAVLEAMAQSPDALAAGMAGEPSPWSNLVAHGPRGAALDDASREHLDHIALRLGGRLELDALREAFELRFGVPASAIGGGAIELDADQLREVWAALAALPPGQVDAERLRRAAFDPSGASVGGWQAWMLTGLYDDRGKTPAAAPPPGAPDAEREAEPEQSAASAALDALLRRPVGRAPAERAALLDAFADACGADAGLRAAAEVFLETEGEGIEPWRAAVRAAEARGGLRAPAEEVEAALVHLRIALRGAAEPLRVQAERFARPEAAAPPPRGPRPLPGWAQRRDE